MIHFLLNLPRGMVLCASGAEMLALEFTFKNLGEKKLTMNDIMRCKVAPHGCTERRRAFFVQGTFCALEVPVAPSCPTHLGKKRKKKGED
ncbi:hypothetical protein DUNSADRAFT_10016 [Dunaliella salina]|uniref:Encoded protein n=1 Tax=Dunaliella salina TaxID=3046 RepID=A0ABQ7FS86_DUNSA|nr:hypothetical protein DUNSADRAFT_10016 [Dunaliella salina]|eukprot:KAF5825436.1 hypothetical protein DUNSADRAFT_10016 [Dunaliella salina]